MPEWLTSGGLFSVQSGWSMISTRIRPELFDKRKARTRIRRLLLDLARGPSEIVKIDPSILSDNDLYPTAVFLSPLVLDFKVSYPTAVFCCPDVLDFNVE